MQETCGSQSFVQDLRPGSGLVDLERLGLLANWVKKTKTNFDNLQIRMRKVSCVDHSKSCHDRPSLYTTQA